MDIYKIVIPSATCCYSKSILYCYWIFGLLTLQGSTFGQEIIAPPVDTIGAVGEIAMLQCEVQFGSIQAMAWEYENIIVYSFQDGEEHYPLENDKYSVTLNGGTFTLWIKILTYSDGGKYTCSTIMRTASGILIVLGRPSLSVLTPNSMEGSRAIFTCKAHFGGPDKDDISPEQYPQLCLIFDGELLNGIFQAEIHENSTSNYILTKNLNITLEASMNDKELVCDIGTSSPAMHLNVTAKIEVLYPVRNITYIPNKNSYNVGSKINCTADANPEPQFLWTNRNTGDAMNGNLLEITDTMIGSNKMQCTAMNTIEGQMHHIFVLANFEVLPGKNENAGEIGNDSWKIAVGIIIPILLAIGSLIAWCYFQKQRRRPKNTESSAMDTSTTVPMLPPEPSKDLEDFIDQERSHPTRNLSSLFKHIILDKVFLDTLESDGVLKKHEIIMIKGSGKASKPPEDQNRPLINIVTKFSNAEYLKFLDSLAKTQQD